MESNAIRFKLLLTAAIAFNVIPAVTTGYKVEEFDTRKVDKDEPALLPCYSETPAMWAFHDTRAGTTRPVYSGGKFVNGFKRRPFKIESVDEKQQNLRINQTKCCDAGLYECIEEDGIGAKHLLLLSVDGCPPCDGGMLFTTGTVELSQSEGTTTDDTQHATSENDERCVCGGDIAGVFLAGLAIGAAPAVVMFVSRWWRRLRSRRRDERSGDAESNTLTAWRGQSDVESLFGKLMKEPDIVNVILCKAVSSLRKEIEKDDSHSHRDSRSHKQSALNAVKDVCRSWLLCARSTDFIKRLAGPYRREPKFLGCVNKQPGHDACGFCKINNSFYIVHDRTIKEYEIIEHERFKYVDEFKLSGLSWDVRLVFAGLTANKTDGYIYLGDHVDGCVWRIATKENHSKVTEKWFHLTSDKKETVKSLCTRPDGKIVVLVSYEERMGQYWNGRLNVLESDGSTFQVVELSDDIIVSPSGVTCTRNTFVVSSQGQTDGTNVVEFDDTGNRLHGCLLQGPRRCHCDYKSGTVIALESRTNRVLLLDMELKLLRVVLEFKPTSKQDFSKRPSRILYSTTSRILFVQMMSGEVRAYKYSTRKTPALKRSARTQNSHWNS